MLRYKEDSGLKYPSQEIFGILRQKCLTQSDEKEPI